MPILMPSPPPPKELGEYNLPNWDLLDAAEYGFAESQEKFVREKAAVLEQALREFDIEAHVVEIDTGPVITMYELALAPGIKVSQITALSNDIARALAAVNVRIVAPVPGKHTVGIEVPNAQKEKVRLKELMQLAPEAAQKQLIPLYLGKDASGEPLITASRPCSLPHPSRRVRASVCSNDLSPSCTQRRHGEADPYRPQSSRWRRSGHPAPHSPSSPNAAPPLVIGLHEYGRRYEVLPRPRRNIAGYNN